MAELTLEPYAVVQRWHLPDAGGRLQGVLTAYVEEIARQCAAAGRVVVGHIKALALFPDGGSWRASVVAPNLPATTSGSIPVDCTGLELILNVLVYGLDRATLERITRSAAEDAARVWKGEVIIVQSTHPGHTDFPSHHHHHKEQTDE